MMDSSSNTMQEAVHSYTRISSVAHYVKGSFFPLFRLYVYFLVLLPSGSVFGINVKTICFCLLLPSAFIRFLGHIRTNLLHVSLFFFVPMSFLSWTLISQIYGYEISLAFAQYKDVFTTIASCWLAAIACDDGEESKISVLKTILNAEIVACGLKLFLICYSLVTGVSVTVLVDGISRVFGVNLMAVDLEAVLGRIQFIADGLIPVCIFLLLRYRKRLRIGSFAAVLMFLLLTMSLVLTFSRYFWAFSVLAFCLGIFFGKKDRFHGMVLTAFGLLLIASLPTLIELYQLRFSAAVAGGSDSLRQEQIPVLLEFFRSAPFFGHGFGSHPQEVIRGVELPYVYEVQIYALAGQEGVVGLTWMALLACYYFEALWPRNLGTMNSKVSLMVILFVWLSAGFFNPMLLNSASAMSYAAIRALSEVRVDSS